jgi:hypothetical protein
MLFLIWSRLAAVADLVRYVDLVRGDLNELRQQLAVISCEVESASSLVDDVADLRRRAREQFPTKGEYERDRWREP